MNYTKLAIIAFLLIILGLLAAQKIDLVTADLGRHLKNGEIFFSDFQIPKTNLYSYTYPDFPFLNHHWGGGVIFFAVYKLAGFAGISVLFLILTLATFFIFFHIAWRFSRFEIACLSALIALPVIAARIEIRPEVFSYFFAALFFWILMNFHAGKISQKWLWALPFVELFWVNIHIYFFLGPFLIGLFLLENLIDKFFKRNLSTSDPATAGSDAKKLTIFLLLTSIVTLINPAFIKGALYPLKIFNNYGYRLFENQSVSFISKIVSYPPSVYFKILLAFLIFSWIAVWVKKRLSFSVALLILSAFFSVIAGQAIRNFTLFGFFALPIAAINLNALFKNADGKKTMNILTFLPMLLLLLFIASPQFWLTRKNIGLGFEKNVENSAGFFIKENVQGPIFNNYDIGSYLTFYLYPKMRVFVDNRPEAYPSSFFESVYVPAQENEQKWKELDEQYGFNAIFFYRRDLTPWAQNFLVQKISESAWAPVFVDDFSIIFLKRNEQNQKIIEKYELPKEMFSVSKPQ